MVNLKDISEELFILNKYTVDRLFSMDRPADAIALYTFYYKTAKWQKTNSVKANDLYVKKCLGWGLDKVRKTKSQLKGLGLIQVVQRRSDGKVNGWYVEVGYLVGESKKDIKVDLHNPILDNLNPTSSNQDTNALKQKIKMLEDKIKTLTGKEFNELEAQKEEAFHHFYSKYPYKTGKKMALKAWMKLTQEEMQKAIDAVESDGFQKHMASQKNARGDFRPHPSSWLNAGRWDDEYEVERSIFETTEGEPF